MGMAQLTSIYISLAVVILIWVYVIRRVILKGRLLDLKGELLDNNILYHKNQVFVLKAARRQNDEELKRLDDEGQELLDRRTEIEAEYEERREEKPFKWV
jgi:hypothetical protein